MCEDARRPARRRATIYLFLPLAHSFALLIQLLRRRPRRHDRLLRRRPEPDRRPSCRRSSRPTCRRSRASSRRSTRSSGLAAAEPRSRSTGRRQLGVQGPRPAGRRPAGARRSCRRSSTQADEQLFENVRAVFGGRLQQAVTGAAPIAHGDPRVLLRLRRAGARGLRHDRDLDGRRRTRRSRTHRFGTVGRALPGVEVKIAEDGEILLKGPNIFSGYYKNDDASFGAVDRRLAAHRRPRLASTRTATSPSPAARRTSSSPRAARTSRPRTSRTT